jgi:hypothetical protein
VAKQQMVPRYNVESHWPGAVEPMEEAGIVDHLPFESDSMSGNALVALVTTTVKKCKGKNQRPRVRPVRKKK